MDGYGTCWPLLIHLCLTFSYYFLFISLFTCLPSSSPLVCRDHRSCYLIQPCTSNIYAGHIVGIQFAGRGRQREKGRDNGMEKGKKKREGRRERPTTVAHPQPFPATRVFVALFSLFFLGPNSILTGKDQRKPGRAMREYN